jgi:hypothetical protein
MDTQVDYALFVVERKEELRDLVPFVPAARRLVG